MQRSGMQQCSHGMVLNECCTHTRKADCIGWTSAEIYCPTTYCLTVIMEYATIDQAMLPVLIAVAWTLPKDCLLQVFCPAKAGLHQRLPSF